MPDADKGVILAPARRAALTPQTDRNLRTQAIALLALFTTACVTSDEQCVVEESGRELPAEVAEASGAAWSNAHRVLWLHNDSESGAEIFAVDRTGSLLGSFTVPGARNRDWEDIAVARCPTAGPRGNCIYIADIGDNRAGRDSIALYVLPEPDPRTSDVDSAVRFLLAYPDGARDAEAMAILGDGSALIVSKGRAHSISVYRTAPLHWNDAESTLRLSLVQRLSDDAVDLTQQITGASTVPGTSTLAIRSYTALQFYALRDSGLAPLLDTAVALSGLAEPQGEAVAVAPGGRVYLVSEAGPQGIAPRLNRLRCRIP